MKTLFILLTAITFVAVSTDVKSADTNTVSSTVVTNNTPPTANAPSVVVNNSDICKTATSGAVQTQILGIASGITITDENCERIKLARSLYSMGMKVASISLLCNDEYRVFDSMFMAGTYCPINGLIGNEAKEEWLKPENRNLIPQGSFLLNKEVIKPKEQTKSDEEFAKFIIMGMAMYIGFPILF